MFKEVFFGVAFLLFYGSATIIHEGVLQMVFDVCDIEKEDQGLTLNEVQKKSCMDHLTSAFGITNDNIVKTFEAVDQNGDSVISKQETSRAFENLRSEGCANLLQG